ncbi:serine hydrolase domain-containing protein [candidate division KSB1 bacterium]
MKKGKFSYHIFSIIICLTFLFVFHSGPDCIYAQDYFPGNDWEKIANPADAGYSKQKLDAAKAYSETISTAACIVLINGKILTEWGDVNTKFLTHSARKSFLSAVYGKYVMNGTIDLDMTLGDLGIDDIPPLSDQEKRATIRDCLKARSGVYHTAEAESEGMHNMKPDRDSLDPGTFWLYNNWDFNVLGTIFEQLTGKEFFNALKEDIADPIQMEHFSMEDDLSFKTDRSIHEAYMFVISARDMARFGLLFLRNGNWSGKQVVPDEWVKESTAYYSDATVYRRDGYGYMWWAAKDNNRFPHFPIVNLPEGTYSARGAYGQYILVIPAYDMVIVHRVNSFERGNYTYPAQFGMLAKMIIDAGPDADRPLPVLNRTTKEKYTGNYRLNSDAGISVTLEDGKLFFEMTGRPKEEMTAVSENMFFTMISSLKIRFGGGDPDTIDRIILYQPDGLHTAKKIK